ncbi:MAG: heparinase II/III family protein [Candidatus Omnitrophica bacterium]|nr:heparinase II/III family protein [Candidatus Omnitrophota bacterium]
MFEMIEFFEKKSIRIYTLLLIFLLSVLPASQTFSQANDISLSDSFPPEKLQQILIPQNEWRPFPTISERSAWEQIPASCQKMLLDQAQEYAQLDIPALPASVYLQFKRNGNRSNYQDIWYERRERLHTLVIAECIENQGRFLDPIADMIWAICEETSWTWPAHIGPQKAGVDLPDADDQVVALFSAQTANSMTLTAYLLGDKLDGASPLIRPRIKKEIDRRILTPFLEKRFGWMGYSDRANKSHPNNWNPWICSNVLLSALLSEDDEARRVRLVHKSLDCLDNFLTYYPSDGSCDEGPSYWGRAGASLFDALEHLYSATGKRFDYYQHSLIQEIARFIYRAHIVGDYFICLGDCDAQSGIPHELVYRFGVRIGDKRLMDLGAYGVTYASLLDETDRIGDLNRFLHLLFDGKDLTNYNPTSHPYVRDVWLSNPNMQLMAARDREESKDGFFAAAWGAHNAQSHNHNDVGNFILFVDGKPILIDIGRPTYTRQTFSSRRYEIWAFQSGFHNLPTINGADQNAGRRYAARQVSYSQNDSYAQIEMDIADAYPEKTGVVSWNRTMRLQRGRQFEVIDEYTLENPSADLIENLIAAGTVEETAPGKLILHDREKELQIQMEFDPQKLEAAIESIDLKDGKLKRIWGDTIYRIRLKSIAPKAKDSLSLRFIRVH